MAAKNRTIGWVGEVTKKGALREQARCRTRKAAIAAVKREIAYLEELGWESGVMMAGRVGKVVLTPHGEQTIQYSAIPGIPKTYTR